MEIFVPVFVALGAFGLLSCFFYHLIKKGSKLSDKKNYLDYVVMELPKDYRSIGFICMFTFTLFIVLMICLPSSMSKGGDIYTGLGFGCFVLLGFSIVLMTYTWRIYVYHHQNYFIFRTFFGRRHMIKYENVISVSFKNSHFIVHTTTKNISIGYEVSNWDKLLLKIRKYKVKEEQLYS